LYKRNIKIIQNLSNFVENCKKYERKAKMAQIFHLFIISAIASLWRHKGQRPKVSLFLNIGAYKYEFILTTFVLSQYVFCFTLIIGAKSAKQLDKGRGFRV